MHLGIDLGGTKIEGVVLAADGASLTRRRVPTPASDYPATLASLRDLILDLERDVGRSCTLGLCTPGSANPTTGLLRNSNANALNGRPLRADLERLLGGRPIRLANDADCFALSEATDGAGAGAEVVFGAILGTGVGGGLVVRGELVRGRNAIAGEWGHNPLPWPRPDELPGPACYCGRRGCIETFLGGPALAAEFGLAPERFPGDDPRARAARERHVDRLARALATVINLLDPDVIVLGGGLSDLPYLYEHVPERWREFVFSDAAPTTALRRAVHGPASGVRGAARLWARP